MQHWYTQKKLIHCVAIFTIQYGNYYPPHRVFKLLCIGKFARRTWENFTQQYGKFARRTWVNFTQQYRKNRQTGQENKFYYDAWQLLLYYYREFPSKILSVHYLVRIRSPVVFRYIYLNPQGVKILKFVKDENFYPEFMIFIVSCCCLLAGTFDVGAENLPGAPGESFSFVHLCVSR